MLPKPKQYAAASAQARKLINQPLDETGFVYHNTENVTGVLAGVCRACLGRQAHMYHMSERGLSAVYAQVVGVQINTEDKLPRQLCWECVGRLSSANRFKQKALKSQWILAKKIANSGIITISDVESIDKAQNELESTLGIKFNVNEYDFLFFEESVESNNCGNMHTIKTAKNECNEDISDIDLNSNEKEQIIIKEEFTSEEDLINTEHAVVDVKEEAHNDYTTACEGAGINDEEGDIDCGNFNIINKEKAISIKKEYTSDEVSGDDESIREMYQKERQEVDKSSLSPLKKQTSKMPPGCKKPVVLLEDILLTMYKAEHSSKQITAHADQSTKYVTKIMKNVIPLKNKIIFEDDLDMVTESSADCVDTVELPQSVISAPASASHNINTNTRMDQKMNKLLLSSTEYPQKLLICDICNKSFHHKPALVLHIHKHPKMYYCTYCTYKTCVKRHFQEHVNAKHTKSIFYSCPQCSYKAFQKWQIVNHVNAIHTKGEGFDCPHCNYTAYLKKNLARHINEKHTKSEVFSCPHCSYKGYRKSLLLRHVNTKHTKSEVFSCAHCSYKAYQKSTLLGHVNAKHTNSEGFKCSHCSYKTYQKSVLARHINAIHTKSQVYNCPHCSYVAFQKIQISTHVNAKHTKGEGFNCSYCSFKTYFKTVLAKHINAKHTKSEAFECPHCSYKAYYKPYLAKHINVKHT